MRWSKEEKHRLIEVVSRHRVNGRVIWKDVAEEMPERSPNQCKTQYQLVLNLQSCVNQKWEDEDVAKLIFAMIQYGPKWSFIQEKYFPNRSAQQIRAKHTSLIKGHKNIVRKFIKKPPEEVTKREFSLLQKIEQKGQYIVECVRQLDNPPLILTDELIIARALMQVWQKHGVTTDMIQKKMDNLRGYI